MTSVRPAELVRVSVHGPAGRADLAVPVSITIADLLPVLLQHTSDDTVTAGEYLSETTWVLQRVGGPPLDVEGTPETLDWLAGEQFYLRPEGDPMPELDFDDVADGMATAVGSQRDRWRPGYNRVLFLAIAAGTAAVAVGVVAQPGGDEPATSWTAAVLALIALGSAVGTAWLGLDRALVVLLGLSACAFAWVAAAVGIDPAGAVLVPGPLAALVAGLVVALVGGVLLAERALSEDRVLGADVVPFLPFAAVVALGLTLVVGTGVHLAFGFAAAPTAAVMAAALLAVTVIAPRVVLRVARLHGPQLPRTSDELQIDIEPLPAQDVLGRTSIADRLLSVLMLTTAAVVATASVLLLPWPGWAPATLVALFAAAALLRSRIHLTVAQRVSLTIAGGIPAVLLVLDLDAAEFRLLRGLVLVGILLVFAVLVTAALRPPTRRPRPVWGHVANIAETMVTIAVVPVLLQILGVYTWALGLAR